MKREEIARLLFVFVAAVVVQWPIYDRWLPLFDEGFLYQIADELRQGSVLYRDVAHVAFPGSFYFTSFLFALGEPSALVARYAAVGVFAVATTSVYVLARTVVRPGWALAAVALCLAQRPWAFPQWQMLHYSTLALTSLLVAMIVLVPGLLRISRGRLFGAGLVLGVAILFNQDYGGAVTIGINLLLLLSSSAGGAWSERLKSMLALNTGIVCAVLPPILLLASAGGITDFVQQTVLAPLVLQPIWRPGASDYVPFLDLWPLFSQSPQLHGPQAFSYFPTLLVDLHFQLLGSAVFQNTILLDLLLKSLYVAPYGIIAASAWSLWRRRDAGGPWHEELALTVFAAALLASFNKPRDWAHFVVAAFPTLLLLLFRVARIAETDGVRRTVATFGAAALIGTIGLSGAYLWYGLAQKYDTPLPFARAPLRVEASEAQTFADLASHLDANLPAGAAVPVYPYHPSVNFVLRRPGIGRYRTIEPVSAFEGRDQEVIRALESEEPKYIVVSFVELNSQPRFADYAPELHAYLVSHYAVGEVFSCHHHRCIFGALERREAAPEDVRNDLLAELPEARVSIALPSDGERTVDGAARARHVATMAWPYIDPVLALRAPENGGMTRLAFPLAAGEGHLRTRVGVNPDRWSAFDFGAVEVSVRRVDSSGEHVLWHRILDPQRREADRSWIDLDLAVGGDEPGTLVLTARTERPTGLPLDHLGFEAPRIVLTGADVSTAQLNR